jgi:hypothetical protein
MLSAKLAEPRVKVNTEIHAARGEPKGMKKFRSSVNRITRENPVHIEARKLSIVFNCEVKRASAREPKPMNVVIHTSQVRKTRATVI